MKIILKILILFSIIAVFFIITFLIWGDGLESYFSYENCVEMFYGSKKSAWFWGICLLVSDILFPIPATGVMAALGNVYGLWLGSLAGIAGSVAAGLIGYGAARILGRSGTRWIASKEELERFKAFFDQWGGYAIIISRAMPLLPETITILAGLSGMTFPRFFAALLAGTVPVVCLFTAMGVYTAGFPGFGILLAIFIPALIWPVFIRIVKI